MTCSKEPQGGVEPTALAEDPELQHIGYIAVHYSCPIRQQRIR